MKTGHTFLRPMQIQNFGIDDNETREVRPPDKKNIKEGMREMQ